MKIPVTYINSHGYIFNAEDYMTIRCDHRIVGNLVGCTVSHSRNSNFNGLPAIYNKYELRLLIEKDAIVLLDKKGLQIPPSDEQKLAFESFQQSNLNEQKEYLRQNKVAESRKVVDKIIAGKKKKLLATGVSEEDIDLSPETILKDIYNSYVFNPDNTLVQVPTQHPIHIDATTVQLPMENSLKYRIFKNLWEKGKYITTGETFGGDFLVYPDDPLYFHASHIVHVVENRTISPILLVARGRLSVSVNKFCVFAYIDDSDKIVYQTMQWEGNIYSDCK